MKEKRLSIKKEEKLSDLFGKLKVDLKAKLTDWKAVKKELIERKLKNEREESMV